MRGIDADRRTDWLTAKDKGQTIGRWRRLEDDCAACIGRGILKDDKGALRDRVWLGRAVVDRGRAAVEVDKDARSRRA
jgi:hypothetical protein